MLDLIRLNPAIKDVQPTPGQLKTLHACIKRVTEDLDGLRFNTAISAMMEFVNEALHWEGCCHVVFVRDKGFFDKADSPKVFHIRAVRLGAKGEKTTEIIAGILPGEVVATKGSDVLRAELLKNNLGEGCTCGK